MVNKSSKHGVLIYLGLVLLAFFTPKNIMDSSYIGILAFYLFFFIIWARTLRHMWYYNIEDDPRQWKDFLAYDMIYMLGLPILVHIFMFKIGEPLFRETRNDMIFQFGYYFMIISAVIIKFGLMRTRFQFFYRFVIMLLFILANALITHFFFNIWYGLNHMGQGF